MRGFGAVLDGRFPHLVLEHLEGPTLDELLRRDGTLALEQLLPLALHVASALHYMAAEGVVHLDVKPSNVVMGAPPRLIDLSVARTLEQAAQAALADRHRRLHGARAAHARWPARPADRRLRPRRDAARIAPPPRAARARPRSCDAGLDPEPADRPTAAEFAGRLEPLVAALPTRMTLGRR